MKEAKQAKANAAENVVPIKQSKSAQRMETSPQKMACQFNENAGEKKENECQISHKTPIPLRGNEWPTESHNTNQRKKRHMHSNSKMIESEKCDLFSFAIHEANAEKK